jgi:Spy/CpxP family protein refolding chaperone
MSKKSSILAFALALLVSLTVPRIMAQTGTAAVDPETRAKVQEKLQQISGELNLSDDQKQQLKPILQNEFQQLKAVKDDTSLSDDQKRSKVGEIRGNAKSQMSTILTPDQQKKLDTMKEQAEPK